MLLGRDYNQNVPLWQLHGNYYTIYPNWISMQHNGLTANGEHRVPNEHIWSPCLYFQAKHQANGNGPIHRSLWVTLNRLRTGFERFQSSMHKWSLAPTSKCECSAVKQTTEQTISFWYVPHIGKPREYIVWHFWVSIHDAGWIPSTPATDPNSADAWSW